ncbi:hypothetical protein V7659_00855, partial [Neobacillus drentensis]|uniref:hypothetical protein n=1 Tax=Neobacillus drentensis TaxID=220684 RepID=UPI002FFFCB17
YMDLIDKRVFLRANFIFGEDFCSFKRIWGELHCSEWDPFVLKSSKKTLPFGIAFLEIRY